MSDSTVPKSSAEPRLVKLVRDRVSETVPAGAIVYDLVPAEDHAMQLRRKLVEEAIEFLMDPSIEELADVFEVVRCAASAEGWSMGQVIEVANAKEEQRGSFVMGTGLYVRPTGTVHA